MFARVPRGIRAISSHDHERPDDDSSRDRGVSARHPPPRSPRRRTHGITVFSSAPTSSPPLSAIRALAGKKRFRSADGLECEICHRIPGPHVSIKISQLSYLFTDDKTLVMYHCDSELCCRAVSLIMSNYFEANSILPLRPPHPAHPFPSILVQRSTGEISSNYIIHHLTWTIDPKTGDRLVLARVVSPTRAAYVDWHTVVKLNPHVAVLPDYNGSESRAFRDTAEAILTFCHSHLAASPRTPSFSRAL